MTPIYLDNNASTKIDPYVLEEMLPFMTDIYGNPSSNHLFGEAAHEGISKAYEKLYYALNADDEDTILITSGSTESINTVYYSILQDFSAHADSPKKKIITSPFEHPASKETLEHLKKSGFEIIILPAHEGNISINDFIQHFDPKTTALVSMIYADSNTGIILPVNEIASITHKNNVPFHIDASQAVGKIPINLKTLTADFVSFSAHKFHGPKGVGGLFIRKKTSFHPLIHGGGQMGGLRSGTLNTPGIVGIGYALYNASESLSDFYNHTASLRKRLESFIETIPNALIYGSNLDRIPNTSFIKFPKIDPEHMLWFLNKNGIAASTGTACSSRHLNNSLDETIIRGIRFSLSKFTQKSEIDKVIECIQRIL
ncbi:MAG: cysteine desulfurase family protein [Brevinemataceae bacterium]